jgi:hypothetical protein
MHTITVSALATLILALPAIAQTPHVHGAAELAVVQAASDVDVQLVVTGGDAAKLGLTAQGALSSLSFNSEARCVLVAGSVHEKTEVIGASDYGHDGAHKGQDHHDHETDDQRGHEGHTNVIFSGRFTCGAPTRLSSLDVGFLKSASGLDVTVKAVLDAGSVVEKLSPSRTSVRFDA